MKKENIILVNIIAVFGIIFSLISLVNHYEYRTYAFDLGMFNQALYSFAHLKANYFTLAIDGSRVNYFADHFSLITILYAPFYYLLRTYTLLVIQIAAILAGGLGAYLFARRETGSRYLPLFVIIQFFGIWGIYSALAFDFHNDVIAAMLVPWLALFYVTDRKKPFVIFFLLILIAKENMAIWLIFILLGLMLRRGWTHWRKFMQFEVLLILAAAVYAVFVIGVFMPALGGSAGGSKTLVGRYALFGKSPAEIAVNIVINPRQTISMLYQSPQANSEQQAHGQDKLSLHGMVLASGGMALLAAPAYLVMLIPIYLQKMLTVDPSLWGITGQYSIEFVPVISLALTGFLVKLKRFKQAKRWQYAAVAIMLATTYGSLYYAIDNGMLSFAGNVNFLSSAHYRPAVQIGEVNSLLDNIPPDAVLSVSSSIAPHLSFRDKIYLYPVIKDADYIVLMQDQRDNFVDPRQLPAGKNFRMVTRASISADKSHSYNFYVFKRMP